MYITTRGIAYRALIRHSRNIRLNPPVAAPCLMEPYNVHKLCCLYDTKFSMALSASFFLSTNFEPNNNIQKFHSITLLEKTSLYLVTIYPFTQNAIVEQNCSNRWYIYIRCSLFLVNCYYCRQCVTG